MHIDQLEAFIYVVQLKSVHKASKALYLSQPTVTARIKTLERELNTELFIRQGRNLLLNQQGKEFVPYAQQILQSFKEGKHRLKKQSTQNEIVFGANAITSQYFIPYALSVWKKINSELRFKFVSTTNDELVEKLLNYELDFAFIPSISNERVHQEAILDNSVQLIVYPEHHFAKNENITVQELAKESLVFFECGAFDWDLVYKLFEVEKVEPNIEFNVNQLEVAKSLIKSKQCIGFLPNLCVKEELVRGELIEVDTTDLLQIKQHVYLSYIQDGVVDILKEGIQLSIDHFYS